jgi:hypothetical protein
MTGDSDQNIEQDIQARSRDVGFTSSELIECTGCGRANAPTRSSCLYCGAVLESVGITKFDIREPESWESGFNVIVADAQGADIDRAAALLASLLREERDNAKSILTSGKTLPAARVESEEQAAGIRERLLELGVKTLIVSDTSLQPNAPPTRLRSIMFDGDELKLELFSNGESRTLKSDQLALIVPGMIIEKRTESVERRKLRGAKTVSETEMSSDRPVIDIYSKSEPAGWRIPAAGFDFSCLGADKSLVVSDNMKRLAAKLTEFSPTARVVDDYMSIRSTLEHAWPSEATRDSEVLGLKGKEFARKITTHNATQFTKYSRLQWQRYEKKV